MSKKKKSSRIGRLIVWLVPVLCVVALLAYKKDDILRRFIRQELAARFPEYRIEVASVRMVESKGVILHDLQVTIPESGGGEYPFLKADEVKVQVPLSITALLRNKIVPERITITRPLFVLSHQTLRTFSRIQTSQTEEAIYVPIDIRGGSIEVTLPAKNGRDGSGSMVYSGIDASILPPDRTVRPTPSASSGGYPSLSLSESAAPADSGNRQFPQSAESRWRISGTCENPYVKAVVFQGSAEPDFSFITITGKVDALEIGKNLVSPFLDLSAISKTVQAFQGRSSFEFTVEWSAETGFRHRVDGNLFQGSFTTPYLNHPVSDLFAHYHFDTEHAVIDRLTARSGPATILVEYERDGPNRAWQMRAQLEELPIDQTIFELLPEGAGQEQLGRMADLTFSGVAKINLRLHGEGGKIAFPVLSARCKDLALSHQVFPFKPDPLNGFLQLEESGRLRFLFNTEGETRRLTLSGEYRDIADKKGVVRLEAARLPIDARLIDAVPEDYRDVITSLHPGGYLGAEIIYTQNGEEPDNLRMNLALDEASIEYDLFPLPVSGITGQVTCENGRWQFTDLAGKSGATQFRANGTAGTFGETSQFSIDIHADRFPLGEEFRDALIDPQQRDLVEKLHLRGAVDADIRITYLADEDRLHLEVDGESRPDETSIQPEPFPYELTDLEGKVRYRDGELTIDEFRGKNGAAAVTAAISSRFEDDGGYTVRAIPFTIDQLQVDHRLQSALPPKLFPLFDELALSGSFNASGAIQWHAADADAPIEVAWDTDLILFRNALECGKPITDICGKTALYGTARDDRVVVYAVPDIDSLFIDGVQVSQVSGPIYFDGADVLIGTAVPPARSLPLFRDPLLLDLTCPASDGRFEERISHATVPGRPITGTMFHGGATLSGVITPLPSQTYKLEFRLQDGNLDEAVRDISEQATSLPGKLSLFANVQGEGKNWDTAKGSGGLAIKDASLYRLPLMIQILRSLSINEKESTGFDTTFVDFQIYGNRLKLERVLLEGASMTLFGDGWLMMEGDEPKLDIKLSSRLGQVRDRIPLVSDVLGSAGDQIAQIKVEGPLSDAQIRRDNFPGIKKAVWSIFPETGKRPR
ncbi:MAG: hypothetical protein ACOX6D_05450 [Thermoguttaceae bacterium]